MKTAARFFLAVFMVVFVVGCGPQEPDSKTIVIKTDPGGSADVGVSTPNKISVEAIFCGMRLTFFLENGEGKSITLKNENDTTAIIHITNQNTGAVVAEKCLLAQKQDSKSVFFYKGDKLLISVRLGKGQIWHLTCLEFIDDILNNFPLCDEYVVEIQ